MIFRRFTHALFIFALILAGASPACEFISGKSLIEICGADGIKTIEVADADLPFSSPEAPEKTPHKAKEQCAFCFAQAHQKYGGAVSASLPPAMAWAPASVFFAVKPFYPVAFRTPHAPRAPPFLPL